MRLTQRFYVVILSCGVCAGAKLSAVRTYRAPFAPPLGAENPSVIPSPPVSWRTRNLGVFLFSAIFFLLLATLAPPPARAQASEAMLPEQSAAKAKDLIQKSIAALGGPAYLAVRDYSCAGRLATFSSQGDLNGYTRFLDLWILPDKNRTEYGKKQNLIDVLTATEGWTLDRGGVTDIPVSKVEDFQRQLKEDLDILLRNRLKEDGLVYRYSGRDIVDLKQVEWVEIVDRERRTFRIALDASIHLPLRSIVTTRDPDTRERSASLTLYSNYQPNAGVQFPTQVVREVNGRRVYQAFYTDCTLNAGLSAGLFTRASLDERWVKLKKK